METVKIYDLEIPKDRYERLKKNLEIIDPSRNDSKKHYATQGLKLLDKLLNEEIQELNGDLAQVKNRLKNLEKELQ